MSKKNKLKCKGDKKWLHVCITGYCDYCGTKTQLLFAHCYDDDDYWPNYKCPGGCDCGGNYVLKCPKCKEYENCDKNGDLL